MHSSFSSYLPGAIHPILLFVLGQFILFFILFWCILFFKSSWCKLASAAKKWIDFALQPAATTFASRLSISFFYVILGIIQHSIRHTVWCTLDSCPPPPSRTRWIRRSDYPPHPCVFIDSNLNSSRCNKNSLLDIFMILIWIIFS